MAETSPTTQYIHAAHHDLDLPGTKSAVRVLSIYVHILQYLFQLIKVPMEPKDICQETIATIPIKVDPHRARPL